MMNKGEFTLWKIVVLITLVNIALWNVVLINMFQIHITALMNLKNGFIVFALLTSMILRIQKSRKIFLPIIITADLVLICIGMYESAVSPSGFVTETFLTTLKNFIASPIYLFVLISIIVLIVDWKIRFKKAHTEQA